MSLGPRGVRGVAGRLEPPLKKVVARRTRMIRASPSTGAGELRFLSPSRFVDLVGSIFPQKSQILRFVNCLRATAPSAKEIGPDDPGAANPKQFVFARVICVPAAGLVRTVAHRQSDLPRS